VLYASALAEWLGGAPMHRAATEAGLEIGQFDNWIHHSARVLVGNETIYSLLVHASETTPEQPGSNHPA